MSVTTHPSRGTLSSLALGPALAGVLVLVAACAPMQRHVLPAWAALCLAAGIAAWLIIALRFPAIDERLPDPTLAAADVGRLGAAILAALVLASFTWYRSSAGRFEALGVAAWLSATVIWFWGWTQSAPNEKPAPAREPPGSSRFAVGAALLVIVAIGAFFRFHELSLIPPHPGRDHAEDLVNVEQIAQGQRPVFFPPNTGQAPLPFYFEYLLVRLGLPMDFLMLKIATAIVGLLAIPAIFAVGREIGGAPLGLIGAAMCAWSRWPVFGARRGLTFAWAVFPAALFLAAVLRYLRRGDRRSVLAAGFWLGLGQYGYNAFKIVPLMVPLAWGLSLLDPRWRRHRGRLVLDGLLVAGTALLVFLPVLQYMLQHPQDFWYRAMTRAGSLERPLPGSPVALFAGNLGRMAQAFHFRGDRAWINSVVEEPFLDPAIGALFLAGLAAASVMALRGAIRWAIVVLSLFILTLPSTLSLAFPLENPGINRAAVAIPSVLLIAAWPAVWLVRRARENGRAALAGTAAVLAVLAAFSIRQNYVSYFVRFRAEQTRIVEPTLDLVRVMREYRDTRGIPFDNVYLLNRLYWMDGRNIDFEIRDRLWSGPHDIRPGRQVPEVLDRPLLFFVHPGDVERRQQLRDMYPGGQETLVPQPFPDRSYYVYLVPS